MSVVIFSPLDMAMAVAAAKGMWLICSRKRSSFTKRRTQVASKQKVVPLPLRAREEEEYEEPQPGFVGWHCIAQSQDLLFESS